MHSFSLTAVKNLVLLVTLFCPFQERHYKQTFLCEKSSQGNTVSHSLYAHFVKLLFFCFGSCYKTEHEIETDNPVLMFLLHI